MTKLINISNQTKTMLCVTIAGLIFIYAVVTNTPKLLIIGGIFDWLPLPTGWMRLPEDAPKNKTALLWHIILTLVAYGLSIVWFVTPKTVWGLAFLEVWWLAVMVGTFISSKQYGN